MPTLQELQAMGAKTVTSTGNVGGGLTLDQLKSMGAKSVAEMQSNTASPQAQGSQPQTPKPAFNPVADIIGQGTPQEAKGFVSNLVQSTIGSKGIGGVAQMGGKVASALSEYGPGGQHQAEKLYKQSEDLDNQAADLFTKSRTEQDPQKKIKMRDTAKDLMKNAEELRKNAEDIGKFTDTTPKQAAGTALNAALTVGTGGEGGILGSSGLKIAKPLAKGASDILKSTKYLRLGANTAENIATGVGFQVGSNLNEDRPLGEGTLSAGVWGGLIPLGVAGGVAAKDALQKGVQLSSEGIINRIIKPAAKDLGYGKEPARGILNEGITANSLDDLKTKVQNKRSEIGLGIGQVGQQIQQKLGKALDLSSALTPLDAAMTKAAKANNPTLLQNLNNVKIALTHDLSLNMGEDGIPSIVMGNARNLKNVGYEDAVALMKDVVDHTKFTGNPSDDKALNVATQDVQRLLRQMMNSAADKADPKLGQQIRNLNTRYGDLSSAATAIAHREIVAQRNNVFNIAQKIGFGASVLTSLATGILSGDWVNAGMLLAGEAGLLGLSKAASTVAAQTRVAKFLDMLGPKERQGILNSTPVLKNLYTRLTTKTAPPVGAEKTIPLKATQTVADTLGITSENMDKIKTFLGLGKRAAEKAGMGDEYTKVLDSLSKKVEGETPKQLEKEILKNTSKGQHFDFESGTYKPARQELHNKIIDETISSKPSKMNPKIDFITGSPASGKSTFERNFHTPKNPDSVVIDPDKIKPKLDKNGIFAHDESSDITQSILRRAIQEKKDITFVSNIKNSPKYREILDLLKKEGYAINAHGIEAPSKLETYRRATIRNMDASHPQTVPLYIIKHGLEEYGKGIDLLRKYTKPNIYESTNKIFKKRT